MYKYNELKKGAGENLFSSVSITVGGISLDELIPEYRTLTVEGRELANYKVDSIDIEGRHGSMLLGSKLEPRVLTVNYMIDAKDNKTFRTVYNLINQILFVTTKEEKTFTFADEPEYQWIGIAQNADQPNAGSNSVKGSFTIYCQNPFKVSTEEFIYTGTGTVNVGTAGNVYPLKLGSIEGIIPATDKLILTIQNTGSRLVIDYPFNGNEKLSIADGMVKSGEKNIMSYINIVDSDWFDFTLHNGDTLITTPPAPLTLKVKEQML